MAGPYAFKFLAPSGSVSRRPNNKVLPAYSHYLTGLQQLRAKEYLRDGAIDRTQIDHRGRFRMEADEHCWHFLLLDESQQVVGCARYLLHPVGTRFVDLRIAQNPIAKSFRWGQSLQRAIEAELAYAREQGLGYAEVGGWAIAAEFHNTRAAAETVVASYLWAELLVGHCVCSCTATTRNNSSSILRRIGGTPLSYQGTALPPYFDAGYGCQMEILRFDSRQLPTRFVKLIEQMRPRVLQAAVVREDVSEEILVSDIQDQRGTALYALNSALDRLTLSPHGSQGISGAFDDNGALPTSPIFAQEDLTAAKKAIPLSPAVVLRALAALNDPYSSLADIEGIVDKDPVISAHLIRLANSGLYNRGVLARSMSDALKLLGTNLVIWQVTALSFRKAYSSPALRKIWDHSVEAAQIAQRLGKHVPEIPSKEVALAALVHDIGRLVFVALGEKGQSQIRTLLELGHSLLTAETKVCGLTHAELGAELLSSWSFPHDIVTAVRHHHTPDSSRSPLADILYAAEVLANNNEADSDASQYERCLRRLHLHEQLLPEQLEEDPALSMLRFTAIA